MKTLTAFALVVFLAAGGASMAAGNVKGKTAGSGAAPGIDWFDGTVDEAFAEAAREDKPVFLYWGAVWCPPCHAINNTVFKSPAFIERSRLFVPVYLDGDTPNAQSAGERFRVRGYPTMIVFDARGEELTRIPGGIDIQAYANVLDLTLADSASAESIVARIMDGEPRISANECTQLAYYSWEQNTTILADRDEAAAFRRMYEACPDRLEGPRSMLYLSWLDAKLDALEGGEDDDVPGALGEAEKAEARLVINRVIGDPKLTRDNIFAVLFQGARLTAAVTDPGSPERAQLTRRFLSAYDDLYADEGVYKRERLYTLEGRIGFARIDDEDAELPRDLKARIAKAVQWADESTPDPYERQPIINAAANVLGSAGMDDVAKELLLKELDISGQPYYFMPDIADIEQRAGNFDAAIDWLKKGYETSTGPATRFQWGYMYLVGLLEMAPEDVATIEAVTVSLISEVQAGGGLYNRPKAQLERLESRLREWSEEVGGAPALASIRNAVTAVCVKDPEAASRAACESFLDAA